MSYCRWSSLNGYCDVYVYEDASGGWTTHVAGRRRPPGAPWDSMELIYGVVGDAKNHPAWEVYTQNRKAAQLWHEQNEPVPIDLPEAGDSFNHPTPGECADNLERLAKVGFIVPLSAIETLRSEQAEMSAEPLPPNGPGKCETQGETRCPTCSIIA